MFKQFVALACVWAVLGASEPATSPAPSPAADLTYNDPAMHYEAPAGWVRIQPAGGDPSRGVVPLAAFVKSRGKYDQQIIVIAAEEYSGTLDGFESNAENEVRSESDGVFVDKKVKLTMPNGMPAYWMKISLGQSAGGLYQRFQYAIFDGKRGIIAGITGRLGDVKEDDAKQALSSLRCVLYPRTR